MQTYFSMLTWCIPLKFPSVLASFLDSHFVIATVPLIGPRRTIPHHYIFSILPQGLSPVSLKVIMTRPLGSLGSLTKHHKWLSLAEVDRRVRRVHMCGLCIDPFACISLSLLRTCLGVNSTSFLFAHQWLGLVLESPCRFMSSLSIVWVFILKWQGNWPFSPAQRRRALRSDTTLMFKQVLISNEEGEWIHKA